MTSVDRQDASACSVHDFNPYELKPLGGWTELYDQLRQESPLVKNLFGRSYQGSASAPAFRLVVKADAGGPPGPSVP